MARAGAGSGEANGHTTVSLSELLAQPLPFEDVPVPEYGDASASIRLFAVTGSERQRLATLQKESESASDRLGFQHELIAASLGAGTKPDDVAKLASPVIDRLAKVALKMTGVGDDAVEEAAEALKATSSADSGSS